jgi:hypothetical protein
MSIAGRPFQNDQGLAVLQQQIASLQAELAAVHESLAAIHALTEAWEDELEFESDHVPTLGKLPLGGGKVKLVLRP